MGRAQGMRLSFTLLWIGGSSSPAAQGQPGSKFSARSPQKWCARAWGEERGGFSREDPPAQHPRPSQGPQHSIPLPARPGRLLALGQ